MKLLILLSLCCAYGFALLAFKMRFRASYTENKISSVIFTGGGTGGHVYPLLAIYEELKDRYPNARFAYIGVKGKAESQIVPRENIAFCTTWSTGYPGLRHPLAIAKFIAITGFGSLHSLIILFKYRPTHIISTGGYASAPALISGITLKKLFRVSLKIYIHEQNTVPGQLNYTLGKWVDAVFTSFPQTLKYFPKNGVYTGYPVRKNIFAEENQNDALNISIPEDRRVVFVFGGSQGARTINRALVDALPYFYPYRRKIFIIHGMGMAKTEAYDAEQDTLERIEQLDEGIKRELSSFYYAQRYFYNIGNVYRKSDLIVARSGAGTINEIAALGKPAILIPKGGLPGDHQVMNARAMKNEKAADVIYEYMIRESSEHIVEYVDGQELAQTIIKLLQDKALLATMGTAAKSFFRPAAARNIVDYMSGIFSKSGTYNKVTREIVPPPIGSMVKRLAQEYAKNPKTYNLSNIIDDDDVRYFRYLTARLLYNPRWNIRNLGVKAAGYLLYREEIPELLRMVCDRTPVDQWLRLLGGDFVEVGFIRRNAIRAIIIMDIFDKDVEEALKIALTDPYYEVRVEACKAVQHFADRLAGKDEWLQLIMKRFWDPCFKVVAEAAHAIGCIGIDGRAIEPLLTMGAYPQWQVRHAALQGILRLLERRVICPSPEIVQSLDYFILTSTDFIPIFPIKETYRKIIGLCEERAIVRNSSKPTHNIPSKEVL